MEKRTFLAILLSLSFLALWQLSVVNRHHIENKEVVSNNTVGEEGPALAPDPLVAEPSNQNNIALDIFETEKAVMSFVNPGARLARAHFRDYNLNFDINGGLSSTTTASKIYTLQKSKESIEFTTAQNGHFVISKWQATTSNYCIDIELIYKNKTSAVWTFTDQLVLASLPLKPASSEGQLFEVVFFSQDSLLRKNPLHIKNKLLQPGTNSAVGFRDRYSCIIVKPTTSQPANLQFYVEKNNNQVDIGLDLANIAVPANNQVVYRYTLYCGPQEYNMLKRIGLGFERAVYFGKFDFISSALLATLRFFYRLSHNWGSALVLLSLFVFLVLYPLTIKQLRSMQQTQKLQPHVEALRKTYKDNPQRLNKEIMELYRRHKVNPLGGCLPMILQIPIFLGLYQALSRSIELKGANFLWIKDLAEPDRLFPFPNKLPFLGDHFNLLPILMALAMFFQQRLSMKTNIAAPGVTSNEQQKMMLVLFPFLFGAIFYNFPSGLTLYWFMNTLLSTFSQWKISKITNPSPAS